MTRMWGIDPRLLCDQHLLGEHAELHQVVGTIEKHPHGKAIARGHGAKRQLHTGSIQARHDALAAELDRRGMNHDSPMAYEDDLDVGGLDLDANLAELAERCPDCRDRIEGQVYKQEST